MTRKSKREIENELAELENGPPGEYPQLDTVAEFLGYDWEDVDADRNLVRRMDNGEVYHCPQAFREKLREVLAGEE